MVRESLEKTDSPNKPITDEVSTAVPESTSPHLKEIVDRLSRLSSEEIRDRIWELSADLRMHPNALRVLSGHFQGRIIDLATFLEMKKMKRIDVEEKK